MLRKTCSALNSFSSSWRLCSDLLRQNGDQESGKANRKDRELTGDFNATKSSNPRRIVSTTSLSHPTSPYHSNVLLRLDLEARREIGNGIDPRPGRRRCECKYSLGPCFAPRRWKLRRELQGYSVCVWVNMCVPCDSVRTRHQSHQSFSTSIQSVTISSKTTSTV